MHHAKKFRQVAPGHSHLAEKEMKNRPKHWVIVLAQLWPATVCIAKADPTGRPYVFTERVVVGWRNESERIYGGTEERVHCQDPHIDGGIAHVPFGRVEIIDDTLREYGEAYSWARSAPLTQSQAGDALTAARTVPCCGSIDEFKRRMAESRAEHDRHDAWFISRSKSRSPRFAYVPVDYRAEGRQPGVAMRMTQAGAPILAVGTMPDPNDSRTWQVDWRADGESDQAVEWHGIGEETYAQVLAGTIRNLPTYP